jgi:hypothetical protein
MTPIQEVKVTISHCIASLAMHSALEVIEDNQEGLTEGLTLPIKSVPAPANVG